MSNQQQEWTEIICVLDRSGSMGNLTDDTIGGFNAFVKDQQKEDGKARLSLVLFDNKYEVPWKNKDIDKTPELDGEVYYARGSTALLDAIGRSITGVKKRLKKMHRSERPSKIMMLIVTDGYENASQKYGRREVARLVRTCQDNYGWEFIFIGAGIDAISVAQDLGMKEGSASQVGINPAGTREAYSKASRAVKQVRKTGKRMNVDSDLMDDEWL